MRKHELQLDNHQPRSEQRLFGVLSRLTVPRLIKDLEEVYAAVCEARAAGQSVGLVPTMGALHAGHLSLVHASMAQCDRTVVTIFVNPTQFAPHEDFSDYPRRLETDLDALARLNVDFVFAPSNDAIYPSGFSTYVEPPEVARRLEGVHRAEHFRGVATVVLKLFNLVPANVAFFGQKDYQQSLVIRHMVRDLNVPIDISVCPIVREEDGLAMSSRNAYLTPQERQQALGLSQCLDLANNLVQQGEQDASTIKQRMMEQLANAGISIVDYVALADLDTLASVRTVDGSTIALVAARVGSTRLIDNRQIG